MTDTSLDTGGTSVPQDRPDSSTRRLVSLEAENAALRRALADALARAERAAVRHGMELASEGRRRADEAAAAQRASAGAEARHGREMAAGRDDLAAAEERNAALARAHDALAESRAALREREERLRLVLDSASDYAIFTTDLDRRVMSWNAGAERLTGWAEAEILGRPADAIFVPEDRAAGAPELEAEGALRDGRAANERWHERKDGTRFWGSGLVMPLRDPEAGPGAPPLGLLKVMRDRTERRHAEEALRGRERRLRLLADTAAGLLAAADPDEVLGSLFRSLEEEFGIDISFSYAADGDGRGLRLASCFGVPEESRAGFARLALGEAVCGAAAQARHAVHVPDVLASENPAAAALRRMGVRAYVAYPLVAGGRLLGTVSFGSRTRADFSGEELAFFGAVAHCVALVRERLRAEAALRESEARFRALARASSDVFYRMCPSWTEMRQLSGGGFIADAPGPNRNWLEDYIHPDDRLLVQAAIGDALRAKGFFELEHRVRRADGGFGWTLSRAVPVLDADGDIVEWFGAASDVTARREAEERLRESEERWRGLFERMDEGFELGDLVRGADGRPVDIRHVEINDAWERHTGIPRDARVGRLVSEIVPDEERAFWVGVYARVVETGEPARVERYVLPLRRWFEVAAYRAEPGRVAALVMDVTGRKRAEEQRVLLVNELNHRVKNTLAVVQSLALQTARGAADLPSFSEAFQARLIALARAHDLLTRENWEGAALDDAVRAALDTGGGGRVDFACGCGGPGDAPLLSPAQALAVAMALHELGTNALKHGALSVPGGRVSVRCRVEPGSGARIVEWLERGGPPVAGPPARRGFGLRLLERGLAMQAGMRADLRFEPEGLRCTLFLPPARRAAPGAA